MKYAYMHTYVLYMCELNVDEFLINKKRNILFMNFKRMKYSN